MLTNKKKFARQIKKIKRDNKRNRGIHGQLKKIRVDTFTKALVGIITIVALIDLQLSYILAFMDKIQIAESLSTQICITILGVAFVYMIRAYFDTRAEQQKKDEVIKTELDEAVLSEIQNTLSRAGINIDLHNFINSNSSNKNPHREDVILYNNETNNNENNIVG